MNLVSNPFFSLTKEVVEDCLVKEELDRLRREAVRLLAYFSLELILLFHLLSLGLKHLLDE